jgi:hypothetical protein
MYIGNLEVKEGEKKEKENLKRELKGENKEGQTEKEKRGKKQKKTSDIHRYVGNKKDKKGEQTEEDK